MLAYLIADIEVTNPVRYEDYKRLAAAAVAKYGGKYIARGGRAETLEGTWTPRRIAIVEFESFERAKQCYDSPEYQAARQIRREAASGNLVVVEGMPA
jgi:uncharacterized protein (DUF1330 family)